MKHLLRKTKFISLIILMIFTVVASNSINHHKIAATPQSLRRCLVDSSIACNDSSEPITLPTPTPALGLSDQERFLSAIAHNLPEVPQPGTYEYILLRVYGAPFINSQSEIKFPPKVIFGNDQETKDYQATLTMGKVNNTNNCYLQKVAADALNKARSLQNIPLKSGYGASDCTRDFATNLRFWQKYANKNTLEKVKKGQETRILSIVAPPGSSQHLWGLAIDLRVSNQKQRQILNQNGWFQTVINDLPHWTYVGVAEQDLPQFGFKNQVSRGITYWVTPL